MDIDLNTLPNQSIRAFINIRDELTIQTFTFDAEKCSITSEMVSVTKENAKILAKELNKVLKDAKKKENNEDAQENNQGKPESEIIGYLNELTNRNYRNVESTTSYITSRMKEGATVQDCKDVIFLKVSDWIGTDMAKYLRPATLFNKSKFWQYHGEIG